MRPRFPPFVLLCAAFAGCVAVPDSDLFRVLAQRESWKGSVLSDMTWIEARERLKPETVVVIPLGAAAKEHGPHLLLSNDRVLAGYFTMRVLEARDVVVAPPIDYSFYPAFVEYPGSTSLRLDTARDLVVDVVASLARHGPKRFYVLNTGVSTVKPLAAAKELLEAQGIAFGFTDVLAAGKEAVEEVEEQPEGTHADEIETSLMLYIAPWMVDMSKATKDFPKGKGPMSPDPAKGERYSASGIYGDATLATAEKGERVAEAMVQHILGEIDDLRVRALPQPQPQRP